MLGVASNVTREMVREDRRVLKMRVAWMSRDIPVSSLRSWRYCEIKDLTGTAALPPNLTRLVHNTASYAGYPLSQEITKNFHVAILVLWRC